MSFIPDRLSVVASIPIAVAMMVMVMVVMMIVPMSVVVIMIRTNDLFTVGADLAVHVANPVQQLFDPVDKAISQTSSIV